MYKWHDIPGWKVDGMDGRSKPGLSFNFSPVSPVKPPIMDPPKLESSFRTFKTASCAVDDNVGSGIPAGSADP